MAVSFRRRGKKKLWDYRVFDSQKKVVASNSGFRTKKEAEIEARSVEAKVLKGTVLDKQVTLFSLWEKWFTLSILPQRKSETTLKKYQIRGKKIQEFFQNTPISQIKASNYQEFINHYAQELSKDSIRRLNADVKKVIQFAKRDKIGIDNFTDGVIITGKVTGKKVKDKYISSLSDYRCIVKYLESILDYRKTVIPYLLYVQFKTGMRFGEVLGLTWDCILWETLEIKTYRRYDSVRYCWVGPKTETSIRTVPIDRDTLEILSLLKNQQESYLKEFDISNKDNCVFLGLFYGIPTNAGVNKYLRSVLDKLEIEPRRMTATGIRHTYISVMLAQNIDIWVIAKIVGHKDTKQITETYGHLIQEKEELESDLIRGVFKKMK